MMKQVPKYSFSLDGRNVDGVFVRSNHLHALFDIEGVDTKRFQIAFNFGLTLKLRKEAVIDKLVEVKNGLVVISKSTDDVIVMTEDREVISNFRLFQKPGYCSLYFQAWATTREKQQAFEKSLREIFTDNISKGIVCGIQWAFHTTKEMQTVYIEETFDDVVWDEAYPIIVEKWGSIQNFIKSYLESDEAILILQGPPGTGKSRLIRRILALLASSYNIADTSLIQSMDEYSWGGGRSTQYDTGLAPSLALYTGDIKVLESDEIFAKFLTSEERVFIVEDADHALSSRANGNKDLHRFLTVSDGIIKSIGRKVIFTTNLPNLSDIDEALVRPGRCFSLVSLGNLTREQAVGVVAKFGLNEEQQAECIKKVYSDGKAKSLAEIYKSVKDIKNGS